MRRKHFLILIYHSLYKIYRLINSIEIKTEFVKKIFIFVQLEQVFPRKNGGFTTCFLLFNLLEYTCNQELRISTNQNLQNGGISNEKCSVLWQA